MSYGINKTAYKPASGCKHAEAFMLMWYACDCGHREVIWNSRDGVTPFSCGCPSCNEDMKHVDWQLDRFAPDYVLNHGQRFWRDGTPDEAVAIMQRRIEAHREEFPRTPEEEKELLEYARNGSKNSEFQQGWPMLDIHLIR